MGPWSHDVDAYGDSALLWCWDVLCQWSGLLGGPRGGGLGNPAYRREVIGLTVRTASRRARPTPAARRFRRRTPQSRGHAPPRSPAVAKAAGGAPRHPGGGAPPAP